MTSPADTLARPPRRRRRWLLRVPIIVTATVVTIVVLVQIFLWTDYPRKIAEAQVERILHVRTTIRSVSIGWLGHTHIEGVALTLPMERDPFLTIEKIDAAHASLPLIAFNQDLSNVEVSGVQLTAREDAAGRWNVQQLIPPSRPKVTDANATKPSNPLGSLPAFRAHDVRATLVRNDGVKLDLPALEAEMKKPDALIATLIARAGDVISIDGQLGQTASLAQSLHATFTRLPPEVAAFFGLIKPPSISAEVNWEGRLTGSGLAGSLKIDNVSAANVSATGRVEIEAGDDGRVVARPIDLTAATIDGAFHAHLNAGKITFDKTLSLDAIAGTLNGGRVAIGGTFDPTTMSSDMSANWEQVARDALATTGSARIRTSKLFNGHLKVDVDAKGGARLPAGEAIGALAIHGELTAADKFDATLTLDPFTWTSTDGKPPIVTPRLEGTVSLAGKTVRLEAHAPNDPRATDLSAYAGGDLDRREWWGTFDVAALRLPELESRGIKGPVDVSLALTGAGTQINVTKAYAKLEKATLYSAGTGDIALPRPLKMAAWAWYEKPITEDEAAQLNSLRAVGNVEGTLEPRDLKADIDLSGSELVFATRPFGDVALHVTATLGDDEAKIRTQELELLGGHWSLRGNWSRHEGGLPKIVADFHDIPLAKLGAIVGRDDLRGQIESGSATLRVRSSRLDQLDMIATAHGSGLSAGVFKAESLDLGATLTAGKFEIKPVLREANGTITAAIRGDVALAAPVQASVTLDDWPAPYIISDSPGAEKFRPRASGTANAALSIRTRAMSGDVALAGIIERGDAKLADFKVDGTLRDKLIDITKFSLDTLDGTLGATAKVDLGNYNATRVSATFDKLTPARLDWSNPIFTELDGHVNGTFAIRPSTDPRAMGPLEVELNVRPDAMAFRGVRIGDLNVLAYANIVNLNEYRIVTERAVVNVAGGRVEPFARLSNEPGRGLAQLVTATFRDIDLGEVVKAADNDGKDLIGKVAGSVQLYGQTTDLKTLTGEATIDISNSDLANFGPIAALYNVLSVGTAGSAPDGAGSISLQFGGDALNITDANYFNRGVYANAFGTVKNLSSGTDADIDHALVVGSLQPLRAVKLPFFGDLNDTLAALQSSVTAIDVTGKLQDPKMQQVSIGAIGDTLQKVLLGKMREK